MLKMTLKCTTDTHCSGLSLACHRDCKIHTRLSRRLATVDANLCSPANWDIKNIYSGALTWFDRCVRPTSHHKRQ